MKFNEIELGGYLVAANRSFLFYVYEKDYVNKTCQIEILDAKRPLLKFPDQYRFKEFSDFKIFTKYVKPRKKLETMNREKLEAKILEILTENYNIGNPEIGRSIVDILPIDTVDQVEEFMITGNQPTNLGLNKIDEDRKIFRANLIKEELNELIDAIGNNDFLEIIDALGDIQYVLDGFFIELGLKDAKNEIITAIHKSNMTKFDTDETNAILTANKYANENVETYYQLINNKYVTYRKQDDKILKSFKYTPVNLDEFTK